MQDYILTFRFGAKYQVNGIIIFDANFSLFKFDFKLAPELKNEFESHKDEFFGVGDSMVRFRITEQYYDMLGLQYKATGYYLVGGQAI